MSERAPLRGPERRWMGLAALCGFCAVAGGAFAAHGVSDPTARELLRTGAIYAFAHALAALVCLGLARLGLARARLAVPLFVVGTLLFSGSLYALAFGAPRWAGFITPVGGLLFVAGWATLAWAALARPKAEA